MNINQFFSNKRIVILITVLFGILILLFIIRLFTPNRSQENPIASISPKSSMTPTLSASAIPSPSSVSSLTKPTTYTPGELKKDSDRINNKGQLTDKDQQVKRRLISPLLGKSGIIQTAPLFQIEYVKAADVIMVEIRSEETEQAKKSAEKYLLDTGLSQSGICNLPVVFYISSKVQTALINSGRTFNPVPDGC